MGCWRRLGAEAVEDAEQLFVGSLLLRFSSRVLWRSCDVVGKDSSVRAIAQEEAVTARWLKPGQRTHPDTWGGLLVRQVVNAMVSESCEGCGRGRGRGRGHGSGRGSGWRGSDPRRRGR